MFEEEELLPGMLLACVVLLTVFEQYYTCEGRIQYTKHIMSFIDLVFYLCVHTVRLCIVVGHHMDLNATETLYSNPLDKIDTRLDDSIQQHREHSIATDSHYNIRQHREHSIVKDSHYNAYQPTAFPLHNSSTVSSEYASQPTVRTFIQPNVPLKVAPRMPIPDQLLHQQYHQKRLVPQFDLHAAKMQSRRDHKLRASRPVQPLCRPTAKPTSVLHMVHSAPNSTPSHIAEPYLKTSDLGCQINDTESIGLVPTQKEVHITSSVSDYNKDSSSTPPQLRRHHFIGSPSDLEPTPVPLVRQTKKLKPNTVHNTQTRGRDQAPNTKPDSKTSDIGSRVNNTSEVTSFPQLADSGYTNSAVNRVQASEVQRNPTPPRQQYHVIGSPSDLEPTPVSLVQCTDMPISNTGHNMQHTENNTGHNMQHTEKITPNIAYNVQANHQASIIAPESSTSVICTRVNDSSQGASLPSQKEAGYTEGTATPPRQQHHVIGSPSDLEPTPVSLVRPADKITSSIVHTAQPADEFISNNIHSTQTSDQAHITKPDFKTSDVGLQVNDTLQVAFRHPLTDSGYTNTGANEVQQSGVQCTPTAPRQRYHVIASPSDLNCSPVSLPRPTASCLKSVIKARRLANSHGQATPSPNRKAVSWSTTADVVLLPTATPPNQIATFSKYREKIIERPAPTNKLDRLVLRKKRTAKYKLANRLSESLYTREANKVTQSVRQAQKVTKADKGGPMDVDNDDRVDCKDNRMQLNDYSGELHPTAAYMAIDMDIDVKMEDCSEQMHSVPTQDFNNQLSNFVPVPLHDDYNMTENEMEGCSRQIDHVTSENFYMQPSSFGITQVHDENNMLQSGLSTSLWLSPHVAAPSLPQTNFVPPAQATTFVPPAQATTFVQPTQATTFVQPAQPIAPLCVSPYVPLPPQSTIVQPQWQNIAAPDPLKDAFPPLLVSNEEEAEVAFQHAIAMRLKEERQRQERERTKKTALEEEAMNGPSSPTVARSRKASANLFMPKKAPLKAALGLPAPPPVPVALARNRQPVLFNLSRRANTQHPAPLPASSPFAQRMSAISEAAPSRRGCE